MFEPDFAPLPPPHPKPDITQLVLTEKQQELLQDVLDHFIDPKYELPAVEEPELSEEEKFWLVSVAGFSFSVVLMAAS